MQPPPQRVTIVDLDVSFGNLVWLLFKIAIASVPAAFLVLTIVGAALAALGLFGAAVGGHR